MLARKNFPRRPQRLTSDSCNTCIAKKDGKLNELKKCLNCGIDKTDNVFAHLLQIREKTQSFITFFERVLDPDVLMVDDKNKWHMQGKMKTQYNIVDGAYYRSFFYEDGRDTEKLAMLGECLCTREIKDTFDLSCEKRDVEYIHEAYLSLGQNSYFTEYEGSGYKLDYRLFCCDCNYYTAVVVPIYSDTKKDSVMGMIMISKTLIESEVNNIQNSAMTSDCLLEDDTNPKLGITRKNLITHESYVNQQEGDKGELSNNHHHVFESMDDFFCFHGEVLADYFDYLHERVASYEKNSLFELLARMNDEHLNSMICDGMDLKKIIYGLFKDIFGYFAVEQVLLFLPDVSAQLFLEEFCEADEMVRNGETNDDAIPRKDIKINIKNLIKDNVKNLRLESLLEKGFITGYEQDDDYIETFYHTQNNAYFFGVIVRWDKYWVNERKNIISCNKFFSHIMSFCTNKLIEMVAKNKQKRLDHFSSTSVHDLAQKAAIMELHNICFENDIRKARRDGALSSTSSKNKYEMTASEIFTKQCIAYNRQMKRCQASLDYLQRVMERGDLREIPGKTYFNPFSTFLANFNQQFNSIFYQYKNGCNFTFAYTPGEIFADPIMIERAVHNLIDNAFKYAFSGTNIYLHHFIEDENGEKFHCFDVTNYGTGIEKCFCDKIFQRSNRGEDLIQPGLGLGLWNARYFARKHGGTVEIIDGVIDKDIPVSNYNADYFKYAYTPFKFQDKEKEKVEEIRRELKAEIELLKKESKEDKRINAVAQYYDRYSIWDSIFTSDNSDNSWQVQHEQAKNKISLSASTIEVLYDLPTYAITFRLRIPQE